MASLDPHGFREKPGDVFVVAVGRLDDLVSPQTTVDLVKIDVEKFEPSVLRGMPRILARDRPTIIVECLTDGPYDAVDAILRDARYMMFHLTGDGPKRVTRIVPDADPGDRFRNFLAIAEESVARVPLDSLRR